MNLSIVRVTKTLLLQSGAKFFLLPFTFGLVLCFSSCDKSSDIGLAVQPEGDLLNVSFDDTTQLITKTVREDSLRTDQGLQTTGIGLIGKYIDPIFGRTEASMFTQVRQKDNIIYNSFGTEPVCDSVVLCLAYANAYYGEAVGRRPLKEQKISVYQATEDFSFSVPYYSGSVHPGHSSHDLVMSNHTFVPELSNYVPIGGTSLIPQLRLPLENIFGQTILNNQITGNLANDAAFRLFMKGLYITASQTQGLTNGEGRILSYNLESTSSKLIVYYHNSTDDSLSYDFSLNAVGRFAHFDRDTVNRDPQIVAQVADTNRTHNYDRVYVQSLAGLKTKITMPNIMNRVKDGPVSINKAELIVKVDATKIEYHDDFFTPPLVLLLFGIDDTGKSYVIPDLVEPLSSPGYYDGDYNSITHEYHLKISRYLQQVLNKTLNNNGLYLVVAHTGRNGASTNANRVVIGGADNASGTNDLQMKLNITYTKLH